MLGRCGQFQCECLLGSCGQFQCKYWLSVRTEGAGRYMVQRRTAYASSIGSGASCGHIKLSKLTDLLTSVFLQPAKHTDGILVN